MPFQEAWLVIPVVAILAGVLKTWVKVRAQQQVLGASNRELEQEIGEIRRERAALLQRLENLEAIVVSQTWDAVHDHSLPPADKERRVASTIRREIAPAPPDNAQRAEQLARRLQG
jgi:hypothetical protein